MLRKLAAALIFALVSSPSLPSYSSSSSNIESRLTITFATSIIGSGSTRTISQTVTVLDSQSQLTTSLTLAPGEIRVGLSSYYCSSPQTSGSVANGYTPQGCIFAFAPTRSESITPAMRQQTLFYRGRDADSWSATLPLFLPRVYVVDGLGNQMVFFSNHTPGQPSPRADYEKAHHAGYQGPLLEHSGTASAYVIGERYSFNGKNLGEIESVFVGSISAETSLVSEGQISLQIPKELSPGTYDLVLHSKFGKLVQVNFLRVKSRAPTLKFSVRTAHLSLTDSTANMLARFNSTLTDDYQKVRCIVNTSDSKLAKRLADLVCAQVTRGRTRNLEIFRESRSTYSGQGFWIRVYATS